MTDFLSIAAMLFVFVGVYLIAIPKISGMFLMIVAQSTWLLYSLLTEQWVLAIQSFVLLIINIWGVRNWHLKGMG